MTVYFPEQDAAALRQALAARPAGRLVACLCADWCGTCKDYMSGFAALAARYPGDCFVWIDIETHADRLGEDIDIENFPTVLIQPVAGGDPHFLRHRAASSGSVGANAGPWGVDARGRIGNS